MGVSSIVGHIDQMETSEAAVSAAPTKKKSTLALQEFKETMNRISSHQAVLAVMVLNAEGNIVTQSGSQEVVGDPLILKKVIQFAKSYVQSIPAEAEGGEGQQDGEENSDDDISFVRIRTKHEEILVAPKDDYMLVVVQDPSQSSL